MGRINRKYQILEKEQVKYHVDLAMNAESNKKQVGSLVFLFIYLFICTLLNPSARFDVNVSSWYLNTFLRFDVYVTSSCRPKL
jgi:hypothetical protein